MRGKQVATKIRQVDRELVLMRDDLDYAMEHSFLEAAKAADKMVKRLDRLHIRVWELAEHIDPLDTFGVCDKCGDER